jgi:hypothetical protein
MLDKFYKADNATKQVPANNNRIELVQREKAHKNIDTEKY